MTTTDTASEIITIKQAADAFGISPWVMYQLAQSDAPESFRHGYRVLVRVDSLEEYAAAMARFLGTLDTEDLDTLWRYVERVTSDPAGILSAVQEGVAAEVERRDLA